MDRSWRIVPGIELGILIIFIHLIWKEIHDNPLLLNNSSCNPKGVLLRTVLCSLEAYVPLTRFSIPVAVGFVFSFGILNIHRSLAFWTWM
ncbi:hypothetical protein V8F06_012063 [Rhypophila decipiens]